ncbi:uncharacterized protein I303_100977 [Kwoniella dejecticola CBS 10117]|uniref:GP-PDE domain-containing protein n=1 Tax=Kwoniella dejecticola CBS 10117 TaxID=1296121 RepID=A0A1A6AGF8_9TREE|nr:uncharacterized protein I303_00981 [Kwoniella dejecticola CBS 10117]OBR89159.1 hypothetical protein I303_00981 [Kwoniella dejecticola CBS 10117]
MRYSALLSVVLALGSATASPIKRWAYSKYFDLQGHRGGRGETIENTLPSFAWGLINGVTSLEMDLSLTKDGHLVVWHDESIDPTKCIDTGAVIEDDPMFPYVGKYIANLTLAQVKTLDCGSLRLDAFPLQEVYPGTKLSTLSEMFDFVSCATDEEVLFNIETKIDSDYRNLTRSTEDFVAAIGEVYGQYNIWDRVTHQSFEWEALKLSKELYPQLRTSALCDDTTIYKNLDGNKAGNLTTHGTGPSDWLAGIDIDIFPGDTVGERVARAAASINADFLSPVATSYASTGGAADPAEKGWIAFTNKTMVDTAHSLGLQVKPWTPNRKSLHEYLLDIGVDGIITDYPHELRRLLEHKGTYPLVPQGDIERVMGCLASHVQYTDKKGDGKGY